MLIGHFALQVNWDITLTVDSVKLNRFFCIINNVEISQRSLQCFTFDPPNEVPPGSSFGVSSALIIMICLKGTTQKAIAK